MEKLSDEVAYPRFDRSVTAEEAFGRLEGSRYEAERALLATAPAVDRRRSISIVIEWRLVHEMIENAFFSSCRARSKCFAVVQLFVCASIA